MGHQLGADLMLNGLRQLRMLFQILGSIGFPLADLIAIVGVPSASLVDKAFLHTQVDNLAQPVDALPIQDLELCLLKGRRNLVLHHFDSGFVTDHLVAFLHRADTANIQTYRGIELQGVTTSSGFWAAEHDSDLHPDLVNKDTETV